MSSLDRAGVEVLPPHSCSLNWTGGEGQKEDHEESPHGPYSPLAELRLLREADDDDGVSERGRGTSSTSASSKGLGGSSKLKAHGIAPRADEDGHL